MGESDLLIEIWSDVVCPWCYIGKRNLEMALAGFEDRESVEIRHRAFQLNPMAHLTRSSFEALSEKYGVSQVRAMIDRVSKVAADAGLTFRLEETMTGNTSDAHRLLLWAQSQGNAQPLLAAMYRAYFEEVKSLFDHKNLLEIAIEAGYSELEVTKLLTSDSLMVEVEEDQAMATSLGANGVPFFVVNGTHGLSGAQPISVFAQVLAKASS